MQPSSDSQTPSFAEQTPAYLRTISKVEEQVSTALLSQSQLLPGSTTPEQLGNIVTVSHASGTALLYPLTVSNGTTSVVRAEVRDDYGRVFLPQPECAVYTGITSTTGPLPQANAWPNPGYAMNNFPVSIIPLDGAYSDDVHAVTTFAIRNNSGADVPITLSIRWRLVVNSAATFQRSDSTSV